MSSVAANTLDDYMSAFDGGDEIGGVGGMDFQQNGEIDIWKQMGTTNKQKRSRRRKTKKTNTTNIESILNDSNYDNQNKNGLFDNCSK